mmetsp:Transcript_77481/g.206971  ORF Transcript_77481/g.206971 Transcript_77481/m.206971 type:complete len:242 (+) Transcript_77481:3-728(+)
MEEWDASGADAERAVRLCPEFLKGYISWGRALIRLGDLDKAGQVLEGAARRWPDDADLLDLQAQRANARQSPGPRGRPVATPPEFGTGGSQRSGRSLTPPPVFGAMRRDMTPPRPTASREAPVSYRHGGAAAERESTPSRQGEASPLPPVRHRSRTPPPADAQPAPPAAPGRQRSSTPTKGAPLSPPKMPHPPPSPDIGVPTFARPNPFAEQSSAEPSSSSPPRKGPSLGGMAKAGSLIRK